MLQLVRTHTALAKPLTLTGKTSDMISHGIGPQPRAKPAGKKNKQTVYNLKSF